MRPFHILSSALLCTSVASAWSLTDDQLRDVFGPGVALPQKRDPQAQTLGNVNAAKPNPSQSSTTPAPQTGTSSGSDASATDNDSSSGSSKSDSKSGSNSDSKSSDKSSTTVIDPRLPAGGISMISPNILTTTEYYKIGGPTPITFAWNYTSLSVTPTAIDILATCSTNNQMYTLALNQTIAGPTGNFTWDTKAYQTSNSMQLLTAKYTLIIHDSAKAISAIPSSGYLSTFNSFIFGMYVPQPYTDLDDFVCVTCSGALTSIERQSLMVVGMMATFAVLGGTWFTGGLGALL